MNKQWIYPIAILACTLALMSACKGTSDIIVTPPGEGEGRETTQTLTQTGPTPTTHSIEAPQPSSTIAPTTTQITITTPSATSIDSWDFPGKRQFIPRTLNELVLLSSARLGAPEGGAFINSKGDDLPSRVRVNYTGKFRDIQPVSQSVIKVWLDVNDPTRKQDEVKNSYTTEGLFVEDDVEYWLPIPTHLVSSMKVEAKEGKPIMLYVNVMGCHRKDVQTTWVFPVSEFLTENEFLAKRYELTEGTDGIPIYCPTRNEEARQAYEQANKLRDQEKYAEAEKLYLKAIDLDPGYCDAMDNLGIMLRRQDRVDEAIQWYQKSLGVKPDNTLALRNMGIAYKYQQKWDEAIQAFQKLIQMAPDDPEGFYGLGDMYYQTEQYEQAIDTLETAEWLYTKYGSAYVVDAQHILGLSYFKLDDCLRSRGYLAPIYPYRSDDIQTNVYLGICYLNEEPKNLELVKQYFMKAEALGAELPDDWVKTLENVFGSWPPP